MSMQRSRFQVPNLAYFRDRGKLTSTSLENCFLSSSSSLRGNRILQRGKEMEKELVLKKVSLRAGLHKNLQPWRSQLQNRHGVGITANGLLIMGLIISFHLHHLILHEETRVLSSGLDY
jgi:hypothetical protein